MISKAWNSLWTFLALLEKHTENHEKKDLEKIHLFECSRSDPALQSAASVQVFITDTITYSWIDQSDTMDHNLGLVDLIYISL